MPYLVEGMETCIFSQVVLGKNYLHIWCDIGLDQIISFCARRPFLLKILDTFAATFLTFLTPWIA